MRRGPCGECRRLLAGQKPPGAPVADLVGAPVAQSRQVTPSSGRLPMLDRRDHGSRAGRPGKNWRYLPAIGPRIRRRTGDEGSRRPACVIAQDEHAGEISDGSSFLSVGDSSFWRRS